MRTAVIFALNAVAGSALVVSWIVCFAIFGYGTYEAIVILLDGAVLQAVVYQGVATIVAGLAQTLFGLVAVPAMALSERLGSRAW